MCRPLAHANFFSLILFNFCVGFCVGQANATSGIIYLFIYFISSAKPTHRRYFNFVSVWPTHKPPQLRRLDAHVADAICVRFAWAWPTQSASNSLAHANYDLLLSFFRRTVGRRKSDAYSSVFGMLRLLLAHTIFHFSCSVNTKYYRQKNRNRICIGQGGNNSITFDIGCRPTDLYKMR